MTTLCWTSLSTRRLAAKLTAAGHWVSHTTVARLLKAHGFSLQGCAKTVEGSAHPDRDAQFGYLADRVADHHKAGEPVISVDTKKKELRRLGCGWPGGDWLRSTGCVSMSLTRVSTPSISGDRV